MNQMIRHYQQLSYQLASGPVRVVVSALGGCVLPYFVVNGIEICPYYIAPWWKEAPVVDLDPMLQVLRGSFLCLPMGGDPDGLLTGGKPGPGHGSCANGIWKPLELVDQDRNGKLSLVFEDEQTGGRILKELQLDGETTFLYERDTITGYKGNYPIAFHPMLALGEEEGTHHLSMSTPVAGFTTPSYSEDTRNGGYVLLKTQQIHDMTAVESIYGHQINLTKQPLQSGIEDILIFISDSSKPFCYTAVTDRRDGYLYIQLKNPKKLQSTMLWISNGGRHYTPWNGRVRGCLGLEETTSFYHYGLKASVENNCLCERGYRTYVQLQPQIPFSVELISGVVPIPKGFRGVSDVDMIEKGICIKGLDGERIPLKVDLAFLQKTQ